MVKCMTRTRNDNYLTWGGTVRSRGEGLGLPAQFHFFCTSDNESVAEARRVADQWTALGKKVSTFYRDNRVCQHAIEDDPLCHKCAQEGYSRCIGHDGADE